MFFSLFGYINITSMICPPICWLFTSSGLFLSTCCCPRLVSLRAFILMGPPLDSTLCCCHRFLSFFAGLVLLLFLPFPVVSKLPAFLEYPPPVQQCPGHRPASPPMLSGASVLPVR